MLCSDSEVLIIFVCIFFYIFYFFFCVFYVITFFIFLYVLIIFVFLPWPRAPHDAVHRAPSDRERSQASARSNLDWALAIHHFAPTAPRRSRRLEKPRRGGPGTAGPHRYGMGTGAKEAIKMPLRAGNHRRGKAR